MDIACRDERKEHTLASLQAETVSQSDDMITMAGILCHHLIKTPIISPLSLGRGMERW
jgi:hypothetical protein